MSFIKTILWTVFDDKNLSKSAGFRALDELNQS